MPISKFDLMLKTDSNYFFDTTEFVEIIQYYIDTAKYALAKKALILGTDQHPSSTELKLLKVELFILESNIVEATKLLAEIEAIEPCNEEVYIQKALILSQSKEHHKALDVLKKALKFSTDTIELKSLIGMEYLYLNDYKNAIAHFIYCTEQDVEDYAALSNVMYCFEIQKEHEQAISFLKKFIDINPFCEIAWHQIGLQYFVLDKFNEALEAFDYAITIDEGFIGGYLEKAKTLERLGRYKEAVENYVITLKLDDATALTYISIGACSEQLNEFDVAIEYYLKAINEDPMLGKAWVLLATAYSTIKDYDKALEYIDIALSVDDTNIELWKLFVSINLKLKYPKEVIEACRECIRLGDEELDTYLILSDTLLMLNENKEVLEVLLKASEQHVNCAAIQYRLSGAFMLLNCEEKSLVCLKEAVDIDIKSVNVIEELFPKLLDNKKVTALLNTINL